MTDDLDPAAKCRESLAHLLAERLDQKVDLQLRHLLHAGPGRGGIAATSAATGVARSTIKRGIDELGAGRDPTIARMRRLGGGRKSAVAHRPGLPAALEAPIEYAIPRRSLVAAAPACAIWSRHWPRKGYQASQRVVAHLLHEQHYSCQANRRRVRAATSRIALKQVFLGRALVSDHRE